MDLAASKRLLAIAKYQFKLILTANFTLAVALCLLTPIIFGIRYLDSYGSSFVLERFVSLIGIVLLTPLFIPEQDKNIAELVQSKQTEHTKTIFKAGGMASK
jgi:cellobiose-specific phosphotransferase system component IIC